MLIYLAIKLILALIQTFEWDIEHLNKKKNELKLQTNSMRMLPDIEAINKTMYTAAVQIIRVILLFSLYPVQVMNSVSIHLLIFIFLMLSYSYTKVIQWKYKLGRPYWRVLLKQNKK